VRAGEGRGEGKPLSGDVRAGEGRGDGKPLSGDARYAFNSATMSRAISRARGSSARGIEIAPTTG